jgi:N4-gp56 family major capsid protein
MATNQYTNAASGNPTNVHQIPELLDSADAVTVSDPFIKTQRTPKNKNETVSWLQRVIPEVDTTETPEGQTKALRQQTYNQVTKTYEEYTEGFSITSRQADLGERDVLMDSKDTLTNLVTRTRETRGWEVWRNGNNVIYPAGITSRITVNAVPTWGRFQKMSTFLENNRAPKIKEMTNGSVNYDTHPIEAAFVVFCHTDCKPDIRTFPNFIVSSQVGGGSANKRVTGWFGNCEDFMFVACQEFTPRYGAGAAIGVTGLRSRDGVSVDIYTYVAFGKDALGRLSLSGSGKGGYGGIEYTVLKDADKYDPFNMNRIVTCRWWDGPVILDQDRVIALEAGATLNPV